MKLIANYYYRFMCRLRQIKRKIRSFYQKIFKGYTDRELWDLNVTFSIYLAKRLRAYKNMPRSGVPNGVYKFHAEDIDGASAAWELILDDMIFAFEFYEDDGEKMNPYPHREHKKGVGIVEAINTPYTEDQEKAFTKWSEKNKELQERADRGLELFAKHFTSLWD